MIAAERIARELWPNDHDKKKTPARRMVAEFEREPQQSKTGWGYEPFRDRIAKTLAQLVLEEFESRNRKKK